MTEAEKIEMLLRIYYDSQGNIRGYVFASTRSYHATEEIMQTIAIKIAQNASAYDEERKPLPWFLGIARHQIKQWYQKNKKEARNISFEVLGDYVPKFEVFNFDQISPRRRALDSCMGHLPQKQKQVVELRYMDDLDCSEIATRLGRSVQSIYSLLKRMKLELRKCVEVQMKSPEAL